MKQLTQGQVTDIYYWISSGFSQRKTARWTGHNRRTIAKYLEPKEMAGKYIELDDDLYFKNGELNVANSEKYLWKTLAIIGAIGHILVLLSYFFL